MLKLIKMFNFAVIVLFQIKDQEPNLMRKVCVLCVWSYEKTLLLIGTIGESELINLLDNIENNGEFDVVVPGSEEKIVCCSSTKREI